MKNLKRKIISCISIVAVVLGFSLNSEAQSSEFGVRYMPTISAFDLQTSSGGTVEGQATLGYGIGAFIGFNFTEKTGIQGEIIYNSLSQKYKETDVEREINLKYINIPILFSVNTGKSNPINLNLVAGPQIGLSVGSNVTTTGGTNNSQAVVSVKKGDLGLAYGAGVDFALSPTGALRLGLGFRGVFGLLDISDNNTSNTSNEYYVLDRTHMKTYSLYTGVSLLF